MKVSVSLFSAFFIAILIVPITAIMQSIFSPKPVLIDIFTILKNIGITKTIIFVLFEYGILKVSQDLRERAYDIYDRLYPDKKWKNIRTR